MKLKDWSLNLMVYLILIEWQDLLVEMMAGFTSGDGSFNIKTTTTRKGKVQLRYSIHLHIREKRRNHRYD